MKLKIYQVDAFADKVFTGNPAAICPLLEWLPADLMQHIAMENNLAETAFYVKKGEQFEIRWFTPTVEVDLCGHATLAAAYVLFQIENYPANEIKFYSHRSGELTVTRNGDMLTLNFPADVFEEVEVTDALVQGFNVRPQQAYKGKTDYLFVYSSEEEIKQLNPDFNTIVKLPARGIIVTAKGNKVDFVSRFFGPQSGINEDPVTGSAHTTLTPYWAQKLGKSELTAIQLSPRTGYLECTHLGERVAISGKACLYLTGEVFLG